MPPLGELVSVGQQILAASVEGSDETVTVDAIGLVVRDHLARYRGDDVPPDFIAYSCAASLPRSTTTPVTRQNRALWTPGW